MSTRTLSRRSRRASDDMSDEERFAPENDDLNTEGEEEPPRRERGRSRRAADDDEDEAPRRSARSRRSRDEDEDGEERSPRSSRRSRDEDEDDRPRRREKPTNSTGRGWKAFKQKREERSDFVKNYKMHEKASLIKILDAEPFSVYAEHWIDELSGKKSFVCIGEDCPLCDIGEKPRVYAMFNILDLADPSDPKVVPWKVSQTVADILEEYAEDKKTSPLNREDQYWTVHKSGGGKKGRVQTNIAPVKARDLVEDWDCDPFTDDELAEYEDNLLTEDDVLFFNTRKELKEIADSLD